MVLAILPAAGDQRARIDQRTSRFGEKEKGCGGHCKADGKEKRVSGTVQGGVTLLFGFLICSPMEGLNGRSWSVLVDNVC